jgi:N-acetylmuramoyl-L-alanine amidase
MSTPEPSPNANVSQPRRPGGALYLVQLVVGAAIVVATLLSVWFPTALLPEYVVQMTPFPIEYLTPQPKLLTATPEIGKRIGIVAGHWSSDPARYDPGAVCPEALGSAKEVDVNHAIASKVQTILITQGYDVDLLEEWDDQLTGYRALALVSIHADSCEYINDEATGFKVAAALANPYPETSNRLVACLENRYAAATGMNLHPGSVTRDMTNYHTFYEIHSDTPAAIIEVGFLNLDLDRLTRQQDALAQGVAEGILCFVRNEPTTPQITPTP